MEILEGRQLLAGLVTEYSLQVPEARFSTAGAITPGPDGNLWFTFSARLPGGGDVNSIGQITTAGVIAEFPVPAGIGTPGSIAAGPDGNLWFTTDRPQAPGLIGRITIGGEFSAFPVPASIGDPGDIAAGPDGNLWFTSSSAGKIGRITTGGATSEFPLAEGLSSTFSIAAGPDGNMWFTAAGPDNTGAVGRITAGGEVATFPAPAGLGTPGDIAAGPDGNLWFTDFISGSIGRITTGGEFAAFPLSSRSSGPNRIAAGSDGNLWFTETSANKIGRITTSGVADDFPIPVGTSFALGITSGPDENLWYTASARFGGIQIGKVSPKPASVTQLTALPGITFNGEQVTFTAVVTSTESGALPTGNVAFSIDGGPATIVPLELVGGRAQATLRMTTMVTAVDIRFATATYLGDSELAPSTSAEQPFTVAPQLGGVVVPPPTVTSLRRFGFHAAPTRLVLEFSEDLDPTRARDARNYRLAGPGGRAIAFDSVASTGRTVVLIPRRRLDLHRIYRLTVDGSSPGGVANVLGIPLDGDGDGRAGGDFVAEIKASDLIIGTNVPGGPARQAHLRRVLSRIEANQSGRRDRSHPTPAARDATPAIGPDFSSRPTKAAAFHRLAAPAGRPSTSR